MNDSAAPVDSFPGRSIVLEGEGQLSVAWRVDEELLVRVPRHAFGIARLRYEVALLDVIRPRLRTVVPEVVDVALDRPVGRAYVAHRRIPGEVLRGHDVAALAPDRVGLIGAQIGDFLRELHAIDLAVLADVPIRAPADFAADLSAEVDSLLRPRIDVEHVTAFRGALAEIAQLPDEPVVLAHTDIGGNVVVDENGRVGIIDFGSCFATHPAFDLASLSVLGEDLVSAAASAYPLLRAFTREAATIAKTFTLQDALYGARQEDWDYVKDMFA